MIFLHGWTPVDEAFTRKFSFIYLCLDSKRVQGEILPVQGEFPQVQGEVPPIKVGVVLMLFQTI